MSLRDFEGEIDPFESTALQAIDVYSELQSVLQPTTTTTPAINIPSPPSSQTSTSANISSSSPHVSPSLPAYTPSSISTSNNNDNSGSNMYETVSVTQRNNHNSYGMLIDVGGERENRLSLTEVSYSSYVYLIEG